MLTSAEYPTFWFYIPYALTTEDATQVSWQLVLRDDQDNDLYQTTFALPEAMPPGIVGLQLSTKVAALAPGRNYRWYFLARCNDPWGDYEPTFVEGLIRRDALSSTLTTQLKRSTPWNRFLIYLDQRFWYDALTSLAEVRRLYPEDPVLVAAWTSVLRGIDLNERIIGQPIVGRYYAPSEN